MFRYTGRGELEGVSDALRGEIHYGYDAEGRLQQHTEPRQSLRSRHLHYDLADNLLGEDPLSSGGARQQPAAIVSNRLTTWQQLFYRYDAWGNLVSRRHGQHEQHYAYDADNRLISARGRGPEGEFTAHYHYDALGRRIRKTVDYRNRGTETTRFLWQGYRLLQEQRDNATRRTWSYDPASPWAPLEVTDEDGNLRWSGQCSTPGKLHGQTPGSAGLRTGAAYAQPLRFAGQYQNNESGLHYNLFRCYTPKTEIFITEPELKDMNI